jgi:hypothetical protein
MEKKYKKEKVCISVEEGTISFDILIPCDSETNRESVLLLSFSTDKQTTFNREPYNIVSEIFLKNGYSVLSFDIPNHGERVDEFGKDIVGLKNAFINNRDPFKLFINDAKAVIDHCIRSGLAKAGKICAYGTSRSGYMVLRLLAADDRISAAAALAPVTDWSVLDEFDPVKDRKDIKDLKLTNYCRGMEGKAVFISIGGHDDRVSTISCCKFFVDLYEHNYFLGYHVPEIDFFCTKDQGHRLDDQWYRLGGEFLIDHFKNK